MPLKLGVSSLGEPTNSWMSSLKYAPSGVLFPPELPRTKGDGTPVRGDLLSAGRGGTGLVGAGDEQYSANCSTSSSIASSSRQIGGEGEKSGGRGGAGSSGGGGPRIMDGGESGGEKGGGDPGENGGGDGGGSSGGGPGERQGVEGVDEGVSGGGESGGGGGAGSSGGGGLLSPNVTHLGDIVSSLMRGLSMPNTSSSSGAGEPRWDAGEWTFR